MIKEEIQSINKVEFCVKVKDLPAFSDLKREVKVILDKSSWWNRYGQDQMYAVMSIIALPLSIYLMNGPAWSAGVLTGWLLLALSHTILTSKVGHIAAHGGISSSKFINRLLSWFSIEFVGTFSSKAAFDIHLSYHHPHTNIFGLGDSSLWKAPFLNRWIYLFMAPLIFPIATSFVSVQLLWGQKIALLKYIICACMGLAVFLIPLTCWADYEWMHAVLLLMGARALFSIPYVHINIFQHIGLPMFSQKNRPARLYQMSAGVLNLSRNAVLDHLFGHSLINCHVEHHLFPHLSDAMCLKIKPSVQRFLEDHGLSYNQSSYSNRLLTFFFQYSQLMVDAPPIWHFVGLQ